MGLVSRMSTLVQPYQSQSSVAPFAPEEVKPSGGAAVDRLGPSTRRLAWPRRAGWGSNWPHHFRGMLRVQRVLERRARVDVQGPNPVRAGTIPLPRVCVRAADRAPHRNFSRGAAPTGGRKTIWSSAHPAGRAGQDRGSRRFSKLQEQAAWRTTALRLPAHAASFLLAQGVAPGS